MSRSIPMMRTSVSEQTRALGRALELGNTQEMCDALDCLSQTPWRINAKMLDLIEEIWLNKGMVIGKLPSLDDEVVTELPPREDMDEGDYKDLRVKNFRARKGTKLVCGISRFFNRSDRRIYWYSGR